MIAEIRCLRQHRANVTVAHRRRGGKPVIEGYASVFYRKGDAGTEYELWEDYVERIRPGAFDRAIKENHDTRGLFNHDPNFLLGRTSSGTCRLSVDTKGLKYEIDVDEEDPDHKKVLAKITRGDLTGSSFAFRATKITWEENEGGPTVRWVEDVQLYDVGPVTFPAYQSSTTGLRSDETIAALKQELEAWRQSKSGSDWRVKYHKMMKMKISSAAAVKPAEDWRQKWMKLQKDKLQWNH